MQHTNEDEQTDLAKDMTKHVRAIDANEIMASQRLHECNLLNSIQCLLDCFGRMRRIIKLRSHPLAFSFL